jgi:hypothetical protein
MGAPPTRSMGRMHRAPFMSLGYVIVGYRFAVGEREERREYIGY